MWGGLGTTVSILSLSFSPEERGKCFLTRLPGTKGIPGLWGLWVLLVSSPVAMIQYLPKTNLRKKGLTFGPRFEVTVHRARGSHSGRILRQVVTLLRLQPRRGMLTYSHLSVQTRMPPTEDIPSYLIYPNQDHSLVTLGLIKLTAETKHPMGYNL